MSAVSRLALSHVTLLAALCGSAMAQTATNTAIAGPRNSMLPLTSAGLMLGGAGTGPFAGSSVGGPSASARARDAGIVSAHATSLRLRKTTLSRRAALSSSDLAVARALPMGGVLSRVSAPTAWLDAPSADTAHPGQPGTAQGHTDMSLDQVLGRSDRTLESTETTLPGGIQFTRTRTKRIDTSAPKRLDKALNPADANSVAAQLASATMLQLKLTSGTTLSAGKGGLATRSLGLADSRLAPRLAGVEAIVANPLVALVPEHRFASAATPLTGAWTGRVAMVRSKGCEPSCADVNLAELTHQGRHHAINLSVGTMNEHGSTDADGMPAAADQAPDTHTASLTLSAAWALDEEWLVAAAYSTARTTAQLASGLPTRVTANGYGMGLVKTDTWRAGDRLSLTLQAPLSARSGTLTLDEGAHTKPLRPDAREWTVETRYTAQLSSDSAVTAAAAYKQNPDHDANADSQMAIGVRYNRAF